MFSDFRNIMRPGSSESWIKALFDATGETRLDGQALREYFRPLEEWLRQENLRTGEYVGWTYDGDYCKFRYCFSELCFSHSVIRDHGRRNFIIDGHQSGNRTRNKTDNHCDGLAAFCWSRCGFSLDGRFLHENLYFVARKNVKYVCGRGRNRKVALESPKHTNQ